MALDNSALQTSLLAIIELERSSRELSETLSRLLPTGLADRLRHEVVCGLANPRSSR